MNKVAIVTGGNAGIGKMTAQLIAPHFETVVIACRDKARGKAARDDVNAMTGLYNVHLQICDCSSSASIAAFAEEFKQKYDRLDVLINNAGAMFPSKVTTIDGLEMNFGLNHMGYFLVTHHLIDLMKKNTPARIINVASLAHRFTRIKWDNLQAEKSYEQITNYGQSKLMNILFTRKLAKELERSGVTANCLHPGSVNSNFGKEGKGLYKVALEISRFFLVSPEKGADTSVYLAAANEVEGKTGGYYVRKRLKQPSRSACNNEDADRLWQISLDIAGIKEFGKA